MKTPRNVAMGLLLAMSALAAGCSSSATSTTSSTSEPTIFQAGAKYVALGSSYAAGVGIPAQSGGICARSNRNYPNLVAAKFNLDLDDVSCSGATTANVLTSPQGPNPPQIDAVTPSTSLVTFTVGGNDIGYIATAFGCGTRGAGCTVNPNQLATSLSSLRVSLTTLVSTIRSRAPEAKIVLVTYPRLVPPITCPALNYTARGAQVVGSTGQGLEQVFVEVAKSTHVLLADPYVLGDVHGPCAPADESWVAGHTVTVGFPYHPTILGHQEMARLTEQVLQS